MDYEKAYKEALERAKKVHKYSSDIAEIKRMEDIFDELKESEDEKIRKTLIEYFNAYPKDYYGELKKSHILAWLEKQGEQKSIWHNEVNNQRIKPQCIISAETKEAMCNKPAWNKEDINKPNGEIVMENFNDGNGFYKVNLAYLNEEQVEQIEELVKRWGLQPKEDKDESIVSDLLDYFDEDKCLKHEVNDIVKWLKTIKPQQKGWGENEIKMLDNLITYLDGRKDLLEEIKSTYISWLKSIKQRIGG